MQTLLTVFLALLGPAALVLTTLGAWNASPRTGFFGGLCFTAAVICALVLGAEAKEILLASLVLLCLSRLGRRNRHEL